MKLEGVTDSLTDIHHEVFADVSLSSIFYLNESSDLTHSEELSQINFP